MTSVEIRRCQADEVAAISATEPPARGYARNAFERQRAGELTYLVAWLDGQPVGSVEVRTGEPAELANLAVLPDQRSRGIGRQLIAAAEAVVADEVGVAMGVGLDNPRARQLYLSLGYQPTGQLTTHRYSYVDDQNHTLWAEETSELLVKPAASRQDG